MCCYCLCCTTVNIIFKLHWSLWTLSMHFDGKFLEKNCSQFNRGERNWTFRTTTQQFGPTTPGTSGKVIVTFQSFNLQRVHIQLFCVNIIKERKSLKNLLSALSIFRKSAKSSIWTLETQNFTSLSHAMLYKISTLLYRNIFG